MLQIFSEFCLYSLWNLSDKSHAHARVNTSKSVGNEEKPEIFFVFASLVSKNNNALRKLKTVNTVKAWIKSGDLNKMFILSGVWIDPQCASGCEYNIAVEEGTNVSVSK